MMADRKVSERVSELQAEIKSTTIADARERREFWTKVMRGDEESSDMKDRLKSSELLGKADGDFVERKKIEGEVNIYSRVEVVLINAHAKG